MDDPKLVLVVEDDALIAMDLEQSLTDHGWHVIGPAPTADQALRLIEDKLPDIAVLDFNIRGGTSEEIAIALIDRSVPIVFLSGDSTTSGIERLEDCRVLPKPIAISEIQTVLIEVLGGK